MSLLDKASLVQIPSGYGDGKLYSVKPTPTYGSELITNGDFSSDSDWSLGSGWSIGSGSLNAIGAGNYAVQTNVLAQSTNAILKVQWTQTITSGTRLRFFPRNYNDGGGETVLSGSATDGGVYNNSNCVGSGTYTIYVSVTNGYSFKLLAESGNNATVDNVSVKEVLVADGDFDFSRASSGTRVNSEGLIETAQIVSETELITNGDFATTIPLGNIGSGWGGINGDVVYYDGGVKLTRVSSTNRVRALTITGSSDVLTQGKQYLLSYSVLENNNCTVFKVYHGGSYTTLTNTVGSHTVYFTQGLSNQVLQFLNDTNNSNITIDNISVKEVFENDVPRLDYSDGSCASLLLEGQSTNLVTYSEDFSDSSWDKLGTTVVADAAISPSGLMNGYKVVSNTANAEHNIRRSILPTATESISVFAKQAGWKYFFYRLNLSGVWHNTIFDLEDGVVTLNESGSEYSIEDYGNGWYRCVLNVANRTHNLVQFGISKHSNSHISQGDGTSGVFMWGAQLESGDYSTSYIPSNSGSSTTRTADVCNNAGTSATFNSESGVLFAEIAALVDDGTSRRISLAKDVNNKVNLVLSTVSNTIQAIVISSGSVQFNQSFAISDTNKFNKIAIKYKVNDFALWINGVEVATDTSGNTFSSEELTTLTFDNATGTSPFYGKCKQLIVFNEALSDEELSDLTGQVNTSFAELANFYNYTIL